MYVEYKAQKIGSLSLVGWISGSSTRKGLPDLRRDVRCTNNDSEGEGDSVNIVS